MPLPAGIIGVGVVIAKIFTLLVNVLPRVWAILKLFRGVLFLLGPLLGVFFGMSLLNSDLLKAGMSKLVELGFENIGDFEAVAMPVLNGLEFINCLVPIDTLFSQFAAIFAYYMLIIGIKVTHFYKKFLP